MKIQNLSTDNITLLVQALHALATLLPHTNKIFFHQVVGASIKVVQSAKLTMHCSCLKTPFSMLICSVYSVILEVTKA